MHIYLMWPCKTANCKKLHAAKYLGEKNAPSRIIPVGAGGKVFSIECPRCLERHDYRAKDLREVQLSEPPPPEFREII
jgi:hypothetical protein